MVSLKSSREIDLMKDAGHLVARVLAKMEEIARPGVTTAHLDEVAESLIRAEGAVPAFKGYRGFPANICISIDEEVVHGIPGQRALHSGDIVSVDVGVKLKGYYGDGAITIPVDRITKERKRLLAVTQEALKRAIEKVRSGGKLKEVSAAIQETVESQGFSVVRKYVGHGIGRKMHEDPQVPNFVDSSFKLNLTLKPGMALAIEPMVNTGTYEVKTKKNGWTVITADGKPSAHFEHTVVLTEDGPEVLTAL